MPRKEASEFGVIKTAETAYGSTEFLEKPADPPGLVDSPDESFASMGNYVFTADALVEALEKDAENPDSRHDMGGDIIPMLVDEGEAGVYDFKRNDVPGSTPKDRDYWRDVGTLASYHEAHLDLVVGRADLQPLQLAVADLHPAPPAAGREVRRERVRGRRDRLPGLDRLRRERSARR